VNPDLLRSASAHILVDDVAVPVLTDDAAHHLFRVLRIRGGEPVTVTDGRGSWRACRTLGADLEPVSEVAAERRRATTLTVACAIPKQDRPEWIVQKLTELGIDRIVLMQAERSVVRWSDERGAKQLAKLRRVAEEALQQSRGVWLPELSGPVDASDVLPTAVAAEPGAPPIGSGVDTIAIGPEGGWSQAELARAMGSASIGSTVLRVETAAIVAAARMIMHTE
jgi:16S rRNA (uracil1498-N3)-methyltransferase